MKKYQRATKNEIDTFLLRNNRLKIQPDLFNDVYDINGNIVEPKKITRKNELTGAGIEYLTSYVEYICTHFQANILDKSNFYFEAPQIEWAAFLDIVTGGITGQRERAEKNIMMYHANPKPVLIQAPDGHLISMQPFVITFDWGSPETLDAKAAARLSRLNEKADERDRLPIESISILFSKPLFEDFFRRGAGTYSFPTGMYAKMFKEANEIKKGLERMKDEGYEISPEEIELDGDVFISAYTRFARYIIRHNNLTGKQMKDKTHHSPMSIDIFPFLNDVYPSAIYTNGKKERRIDKKEFTRFLGQAIALYRSIPNFILYPVLESIDSTQIHLAIYTSMEAADNADREKNAAPIITTSAAERALKIREYKEKHPDMSNRMIAEKLKCNEKTVRIALKQP